MSIVVGVPPSGYENAFDSARFPALRMVASLMPVVLIGIGSLAMFYLSALIFWAISISLGIL
jgi:hypothetical protein